MISCTQTERTDASSTTTAASMTAAAEVTGAARGVSPVGNTDTKSDNR